jgi:hypothetical protein
MKRTEKPTPGPWEEVWSNAKAVALEINETIQHDTTNKEGV